jgi:hypothetical protein
LKSPTLTSVRHIGKPIESIKMGMRAEDLPHLASILTDLYSRPKEAVMREYATNAYDANIEAGNSLPVEITLPSTAARNFIVRDSGPGLDVDDIRDIYVMFGLSTKRESNDVVGYLGLGCKSGLTYTDAFTVSSVKDGVRTTVQIAKDNDGVGVARVLDVSDTTRANGTTVTIPVKPEDVTSFHQIAKEIYKYWEPGSILVDGDEPDRSHLDHLLWMEDVTLDGMQVGISRNGTSKIIMGNVAYPWEPKLDGINTIARVPIGSVDFAPSREALMFNTYTEGTLKELRDYIREMAPIRMGEVLDAAPSPWDQFRLQNVWRYARVCSPAFKGRGVQSDVALPKGISAWEYERAAWKNKAARHTGHVGFELLNRATVITGFPYKALSAVHKRRLEHTIGNTWLMLHEETDLSLLEGHPRLISWDRIVEETTEKVAPDPRSPRVAAPTIYAGTGPGGNVVRTEQFEQDPNVPLLYRTVDHQEAGWYRRRHPNVMVVELRINQVDRFLRLHPWALSAMEYDTAEMKRLRESASESTRIKKHMRRHIFELSSSIDLTRVKDMELHRLLRIAKNEDPDLAAVTRLGIDWTPNPIHAKIASRYPLLFDRHGSPPADDALIYANSKFQALGLTNRDTDKDDNDDT